MKKKFLSIAFGILSIGAFAQNPVILSDKEVGELDIDSLNQVLNDVMDHTNRTTTSDDEKKAWSRKTFLRIAYTNGKMKPASDIDDELLSDKGYPKLDGVNDEAELYNFKNDYGISLINGRSYNLHKKPISKMVMIALDYTWIDLCYNHYKAFYSEDGMKYDPNVKYGDNDDKNYAPWGMEKHELNYGMSLGPSVTIAPFGLLDNEWRNLQLQTYFHVGYSVSAIMMVNKKTMREELENSYYVKNSGGSSTFQLGTGVATAWGINLSWKNIGLGLETRKMPVTYKSMETSDYGKVKTKMEYKDTRFYVNFRF